MKRTLLERIQQIDIDPNYCMRMSEIIEIADNSRGCDLQGVYLWIPERPARRKEDSRKGRYQ